MIFSMHVKKWRHAHILFSDKFVTFANPWTHLGETHVSLIRMGPFCAEVNIGYEVTRRWEEASGGTTDTSLVL